VHWGERVRGSGGCELTVTWQGRGYATSGVLTGGWERQVAEPGKK
jgi:hypothetical protein